MEAAVARSKSSIDLSKSVLFAERLGVIVPSFIELTPGCCARDEMGALLRGVF